MTSGLSRQGSVALLSDRDRVIIGLVGQFKQLTTNQLAVLGLGLPPSHTSVKRVLARLVAGTYLARIARPVGGMGGGSAQYVYQLGRAGHRLLGGDGSYWAYLSVNEHTLAIADSYMVLKQAEGRGTLAVLSFQTEPACHLSFAGIQLTPDAYAELGVIAAAARFEVWLEIDRGTEHDKKIKDKCIRYWHAYRSPQWDRPYFPYVLFIVPDERRRAEIQRVIRAGPQEAQAHFYVCLSSEVTEFIHSLTPTEVESH
jgi:hypothetical protein